MGAKLVANILAALGEQTIAVPGQLRQETALPHQANNVKNVLAQPKPSPAR